MRAIWAAKITPSLAEGGVPLSGLNTSFRPTVGRHAGQRNWRKLAASILTPLKAWGLRSLDRNGETAVFGMDCRLSPFGSTGFDESVVSVAAVCIWSVGNASGQAMQQWFAVEALSQAAIVVIAGVGASRTGAAGGRGVGCHPPCRPFWLAVVALHLVVEPLGRWCWTLAEPLEIPS